MASLLKKAFFVLLLGSGVLLTAPAAFADHHHHHRHHHYHHHDYYRHSYSHRPSDNRNWYGQRQAYPPYRDSQRSYGPYVLHQDWQRSHHHRD